MARRGNRSRSRNSNRRSQQDAGANQNGGTPRKGSRSGGGGGGSAKQKRRQIPFDPEKHFLPEPVPERTYDPCPLSGEEIDDITSAIAHPQTGRPARFESVIRSLSSQVEDELSEDHRIAYLGRGTFGLITFEKIPGKSQPMLVVKRYFEYEDNEKHQWRRELAPGISRDYIPEPQPLAELYTQEELASFPRFDASGSGFSSRNG